MRNVRTGAGLLLAMAVIAVFPQVTLAGAVVVNAPELGSASALTALAILVGSGLMWANRNSSRE